MRASHAIDGWKNISQLALSLSEVDLKLAVLLNLSLLPVALAEHKRLKFPEPDPVCTSADDPFWIF